MAIDALSRTRTFSALLAAALTGVTALLAGPARAQDTLEEIVVTAQKREQNLQDVGVSVTALNANQLRELGIVDSSDIDKVAPGVVFSKAVGGDANGTLSVRGVTQSDFSQHQESPNAIYIDEIYLSTSGAAGFDLFDLERVEVLRGPQGTLFGRNSTGGLASFITAKPTSAFESYVDVGYGRFNQFYTEAAVSGPLSDRVRSRLSGRYERADGWWENRAVGGQDIYNKKSYGLRGQIEIDVTDDLTAAVSLTYQRKPRTRQGTYKIQNYYIDQVGQPVPLPADLDAFGTGPGNNFFGYRDPYSDGPINASNNVGFHESELVSPTLRLEWRRGSTTFTSLTNYSDYSTAYNEDDDGSSIDMVQAPTSQKMAQWSQELRATGQVGRVTWTAGAYYLDIDNKEIDLGFAFTGLAGTDFAFDDINLISQRTKSYSVFSQVEWMLTDRLRLTAGARYTRDEKAFDSKVYFNEVGNALLVPPGDPYPPGSTIFDPPLLIYDFSKATVGDLAVQEVGLWSGKVQLDYIPAEGRLLYAGISRGVKGGGFNSNVGGAATVEETPFKPESMYAFEVGGKFDLLDRRLRLNSGLFYYDYKDFQGFAFNGIQGVVGNYDGAFYGGEMETIANLPSDIQIRVGVSYIRSKLKDIPTAYNGVRDQQSIMAPNWLANGMINKSVNLGPGTLGMQWSFDYIDDRYASVDNNPAVYVKGSLQHHARITYELQDRGIELAAFVNNISDEKREVFAYDFISATGGRLVVYAPPRWWGLSVRRKF